MLRRLPIMLAVCVPLIPFAPAFAQMPPKQVGVVEVQQTDVPRVMTLPGRAIAVDEVGLRPRVSGMVTEILYSGGTHLEAGTPMFRLDPSTFTANMAAAEAEVAAAQAAASVALSTFQRGERLVGSGVSAAEVENQKAAYEQAEARVEAAKAALELRRLELGWSEVVSPIAGMAGMPQVSVGDLVSPSQAVPLATITSLNPIDVDLYEPSARISRVYDDIDAGVLTPHPAIRASLRLETGEVYAVEGELVAPGFTVSTSTGAVDNRFRFENPDRRLLPGMFLRAEIEIGTIKAVLVSQTAAARSRTGALTAWVLQDGKPVQRQLRESGTYQHHWIVTEGIASGELLVVDGIAGLREGMEVVPVPVAFDASGVVRAAPAAAPQGAAPATGGAPPPEGKAPDGAAPAPTPAE